MTHANSAQRFKHAATSLTSIAVVPASELAAYLENSAKATLGIVSYANPVSDSVDAPVLDIELKQLEGEPLVELWQSNEPVEQGTAGAIRYCRNSKLVFASLDIECKPDLQQQTEAIYRDVLSFVNNSGYPYLLRVWNHFPRINEYDHGMERYQSFCVGRHNAFKKHYGDAFQCQLPAASAIGTYGTKFSLHLIASTEAGVYLENPRQVSAYQYPEQYGPCSPSFARATLFEQSENTKLILSGTASIVGHQTLHTGEPLNQLQETLRNIDMLLQSDKVVSRQSGGDSTFDSVKVYVRNPRDLQLIKNGVIEYFGEQTKVLFLHGDICRHDLLLEIEGISNV